MLDFTYTCRGCDKRFSLLVGDPKAELCPGCTRALCAEVAAGISAELLEDVGRENGELAAPSAGASPEELYDELVGALLDVRDLISARAPAGAHCGPEDGPLYRRVFAALEKAAV